MQDVVDRLRKLKEDQPGHESYGTGDTEGRQWAMNRATPGQLERLDHFRGRHSSNDWNRLFETEEGWRELARQMEPSIGTKSIQRRSSEKSFWKKILDDKKISDVAFFRGFADGSLAVWREVRDQI